MNGAEDEVEDRFNPQVLFEKSGAANAGIDNPNIYGVLRSEMPPSLEDCVQEQVRAGRRLVSNTTTDSYTICISFESLLLLWQRIYRGTVYKISYREILLLNLEVDLDTIVLRTHCLLLVFAGRCANPFDIKPGQLQYIPHPCLTSCSFCNGEYDKLFPTIIRSGVCKVIMDFFLVITEYRVRLHSILR